MAGWKKPSDCRILGKPQTRLDGRILRSPHAHAQIESIDASAAEKMPGVKAVIISAVPNAQLGYAGDEIGAVAATSSDIAEDAIRAIKVKYKPLPHCTQEPAA